MMDDRFDELMRDAAHTYRKPAEPDFEAMWNVVAKESFGVASPTQSGLRRSLNLPDAAAQAHGTGKPAAGIDLPPLAVECGESVADRSEE